MKFGDMAVFHFGNGRQTINCIERPIKLIVKSGIQDIPGMDPTKEYPCRLVELGTKMVCRFTTKSKKTVDMPLQKLHFVRQLK